MNWDPSIPTASTADKNSFAYISARERWPFIITGIIEDVRVEICERKKDKTQEDAALMATLKDLKDEILGGDKLKRLKGASQSDIKAYNEELQQRGDPSWFDVSWLYAECYLYRRISTIFNQFQNWKDYDPFARQKMSTFASSHEAVLELAARYKHVIRQLQQELRTYISGRGYDTVDKVLFEEMCEISLWGNATDLSLLTSLSYEDIKQLQGANAREKSRSRILVNDLPAVYELLVNQRTGPNDGNRRFDIVLDNSGFELYVDLLFAGYLLSAKFATKIVLHPKDIPWFVSDVIPADFDAILKSLQSPQIFFPSSVLLEKETEELKCVYESLHYFHANGSLVLSPHPFWTHGGSYWRLPSNAPDLYKDFQSSKLVIFKGDLNYRKLTADAMWDPTTPFTQAIGPMGPQSGINVLALRTCKADVIVGLSAGQDEDLKAQNGCGTLDEARRWAWTGKWAVASFSQGARGNGTVI